MKPLTQKGKKTFAVTVAAIYFVIAVIAASFVVAVAIAVGASGWLCIVAVIVAFGTIAPFMLILMMAITGDDL